MHPLENATVVRVERDTKISRRHDRSNYGDGGESCNDGGSCYQTESWKGALVTSKDQEKLTWDVTSEVDDRAAPISWLLRIH